MSLRKRPPYLRKCLHAAVAGTVLLGFYGASAQAQDGQDLVEEVVVVGSQIRGARITGALPVSVVSSEDIAATAALSGDDLFRSIPEAGDITFNGTFLGGTNSNAARGDVSTVSLRGLPQGNTLLLLNGRRSVVHPTSQTDNNTPVFGFNVNALPVAGMERVEILKDGAAALYGSDAVAGVVNNVLKSDFEGTEINIMVGSSEVNEWTANIAHGIDFGNGRGNASFFFGYTQKDALLARDQDFLLYLDRRPMVEGTSFEGLVSFDQRGAASGWGGFQAIGAGGPVAVNGQAVTDSAGNFHLQPQGHPGCTYSLDGDICYSSGLITSPNNRPLRMETRLQPDYTMLPSVERYNAFSFVNYEFDNVSFFGELGYYFAETEATSTAPGSLASTPIHVPAQNYYNPFGPTGSPNRLPGLDIPDEGLPIRVRTFNYLDAGGRLVEVENYQYRLLAGLRGEAFGWDWESAVLYNEANVKDTQDHGSSSLLQQVLARSTPDAYNPFGGGMPDDWIFPAMGQPNPQSVIDDFMINATRQNNTSLALWDLRLSRSDLFSLPAGDVGTASGIEFRREGYKDDRDRRQDESSPYTDMVTGIVYGSDLMGHSPSPDVTGSRNVFSAYVEFGVPVVSPDMNIPLMQSLDFQLAGRFEDYSDVGNVAKPKIAGAWDVIDGLRLRGSWSEGFKAPNLEVINIRVMERLLGRQDYIKCEADLRSGAISDWSLCTQSYGVPSLRQGNQNLVPEESTSYSYGVVFEPMFLPVDFGSLVFTIDNWRLKQTGIVGNLDDTIAIGLDYIARLEGSSNPNVVRMDPSPAEIEAFSGTGLAPVGQILHIDSAFDNLLPLEVAGIDFGIVYQNEFPSFGNLRLNFNATKLNDYFQDPSPPQQQVINASQAGLINPGVPVAGISDLVRQNGRPEWKWTLSSTWSRDQWQVGFQTQYTGSVEQSGIRNAAGEPWQVDSLQTFNLYGQYRFDEVFGGSSTVRVGARNLTNEQPPFARGGYLGNIHSPYGRYLYANISHTF